MDHNQERRRGHFRGRRGPDRRGPDRRSQPPQAQPRDQIDVEQIMRDIRSRIAQRQGIDFSTQQIQDLAARKLESILDPRVFKPSLLDALRRGAAAAESTSARPASEPVYTFDDKTIYDSHRGLMRFIRRLLNPILKLFFNPNPLIRALHLQAQMNVELAAREAERERRQTEWNALHYEIVQRLVTEIARLSLDVQALTMRVESLNGRVDFTDRRVRSMESTAGAARTPPRPVEPGPPVPVSSEPGGPPVAAADGVADGSRRRRRRRRGRRGPGSSEAPGATESIGAAAESAEVAPAETRELPPAPAPETAHEAVPSPDAPASGEPSSDGSEQ